MKRTVVGVLSPDPLLHAGVTALLRDCQTIETVPDELLHDAEVLVVAQERMSTGYLRTLQDEPGSTTPIVLVVREMREPQLLSAVERGVRAIVPMTESIVDELAEAIRSVASGSVVIPQDLLSPLLAEVRRLEEKVLRPRGLTSSGLTQREIDVLVMIAEGRETADIADALWFSQRTVKNIVQGMLIRLELRNRAHAVAYATQMGVI
ncbi:response regulator transcription factor [Lentzea sp.]|uniref:helix-turn-helix transcriptional regulator n=1 Tax=Lentzea sp. TaxID=56099 RepID=UPI002CE2CD50|nr:response regulator transcription factor [Lentzea sp.]HUQ57792.1 response regulator transcription factor [Lentzea sp.]